MDRASFEHKTGLRLLGADGELKKSDDMPPMNTFLNRLLALRIEDQNALFVAFDQILTARIEGAIASGTYDVGLETLTAESFVVTGRQTIYTHPGTSAETRLLTITPARAQPAGHARRGAGPALPIPAPCCWSTASRAAPPCRFPRQV